MTTLSDDPKKPRAVPVEETAPPQTASRRRAMAAAAGVVVALLAAGVYVWSRKEPGRSPPARSDAPVTADATAVVDAAVPSEMVSIAGGPFETGFKDPASFLAWCQKVERDGSFCQELVKRATPIHRTGTVESFSIDRTEVTRGQLATWLSGEIARGAASVRNDRVLDAHGNPFAYPACDHVSGMKLLNGAIQVEGSPNAAVVCVTFLAAEAYCDAQHKRLPTLAEWELAAGGTEHRLLPWGDAAPTCDDVIYGRDEGGACARLSEGPQPAEIAGRGDMTPEGVVGLGGNVSEWVEDPSTPAGSSRHIAAGGSWTGGVADMTPGKILLFGTPDNVFPGQATIGFRCARTSR